MVSKVAVVVPTYNEAWNVKFMLRELGEWRTKDESKRSVVFVNDKSDDGTEKILREERAEFVDSNEGQSNVGKGAAFVKGVRHVHMKYCPDIIVTLDADLIRSPVNAIDQIVEELHSKKVNMVIGTSRERFSGDKFNLTETSKSGQRAIAIRALMPLIKGNKVWEKAISGYGMEACLNLKVSPKYDSSAIFYAGEALRRIGPAEQRWEINRTDLLLSQRLALGRSVKAVRKADRALDGQNLSTNLAKINEILSTMVCERLVDDKWVDNFRKDLYKNLRSA